MCNLDGFIAASMVQETELLEGDMGKEDWVNATNKNLEMRL